ncbi:hypothetical protein [Amycolatopsis anabasis]|uniref:hypothetical protein n=1 Tax=Amycolatopsis anabasis TaxID=1840409 RepID=UPI00131A9FB2|nr:hypothetical protein [Amycolatopsis anabasis]
MTSAPAQADSKPRHGRLLWATALLVIGVGAVSVATKTSAWWWGVPGYGCLSLVPALIFDALTEELRKGGVNG